MMTEKDIRFKGVSTRQRLRSVGVRTLALVGLLILGALLTFRNSPLNILNLFQRSIEDPQTEQRVKEQQAEMSEVMHEVTVAGRKLTLPKEFSIEVFAEGRGKLRMMAQTPDYYLFVTEQDRGNVLSWPLLPNLPGYGTAQVALTGLDTPSGIAFYDGAIWVAEHDKIKRFSYRGQGKVGEGKTVIESLPARGSHVTRTIGFGEDGKLYVAVGSSCNVCEEKDKRRAALLRYNPDGSGEEIFAEGLRNTVGFVWHPQEGEIWGVDNGRDLIGDDLPPEEVNIIREGKHYGWPYCYGRGETNPEYRNRAEYCQSTEFPIAEMQAHSAPLGLRFYQSPPPGVATGWPPRYDLSLFIGFHGSWNRSIPTGYKVVRLDKDGKVHDFVFGWLDEQSGKSWGRPVDILFFDEAMFVTDDSGGRIFKIILKE